MKLNYPWQLYHWHFEVSGKCTLKCPRCPRNDMAPVPWMNKELTLGFFKKVLPPELLKTHVKRITLCGDIGDPIYASQYLDIVEYIKLNNPKIHVFTITNGSYRKAEWWERLAAISNEYDTVNFSIDGYDQESNNLYRIGSNWDSIMQGMDIMCNKSSAFVYWAAIIFSFNQDRIDDIHKQAKEMGCDGVQLTYSTKFGNTSGESYGGENDTLKPRPEFISKTYRYERHFRNISGREQHNADYMNTNIKMFEEISKTYQKFITPMCSIGNRGLYVSADGVIHPCSWVSYPYVSLTSARKIIKFEDSFHQVHRDKLNLNERTLEDILNDDIWSHLFNSFDDESKTWVECEQKCNCSLVNKEYAVGFLTN
jgi:MoaA/NifB/PqqE/SkfB family radical SAM enzyme